MFSAIAFLTIFNFTLIDLYVKFADDFYDKKENIWKC